MSKKKNKIVSFKELTSDKLKIELMNRKKELLSLRFKQRLGELTDTSMFNKARKAIARIKTELSSKVRSGE